MTVDNLLKKANEAAIYFKARGMASASLDKLVLICERQHAELKCWKGEYGMGSIDECLAECDRIAEGM